MRLPVHKVLLKGATKSLPITIATADFARIPVLVNASKPVYNGTMGEVVQSFEVTDTLYTMNMTDDQYAEELMMVDILDVDTTQFAPPPTLQTFMARRLNDWSPEERAAIWKQTISDN